MQRVRNQDDEFSTLFKYLNRNNGNNNNLKQLIDEAFPSYHASINVHVIPHSVMFRGPPSAAILTRTDLTSAQTTSLVRLVSDISMTGLDITSLLTSRFVGDNSARDELAIHLTTVAATMHSWVSMTKNTLITGTYVFIWQGWSPATVIGYLEAFAKDMGYTAREYMTRETITGDDAQQIAHYNLTIHSVCCTLAGLYHVARPSSIKFMPNTFIGESHPRKDLPRIQTRHVVHPADPDGGVPYQPGSLVDEQGNVHGFDAPPPGWTACKPNTPPHSAPPPPRWHRLRRRRHKSRHPRPSSHHWA
jgi:hypothetical protein